MRVCGCVHKAHTCRRACARAHNACTHSDQCMPPPSLPLCLALRKTPACSQTTTGVRLTCGVERAFVHAVDAVVQQTQRLGHVVARAHGRAGDSARLLQETQDVRRRGGLSTNPAQTPAGEGGGGKEGRYGYVMVMVRIRYCGNHLVNCESETCM